jgi:aspartokinase-like uncharacterized kinase
VSVRSVVKVGGSLCADPARLRALLAALAEGAFGPCLVVPGGGADADAVRLDQARLGFDDAEAHRRALDAMSRMAGYFQQIEPRLLPSPLCEGGWASRQRGSGEASDVSATGAPLAPPAAQGTLPRRGGREDALYPIAETRNAIWDPVALRAGHPDIPETWDVTSDSLALWAATQIRAARCILVKSADAPAGADARALARIGLVDVAFPAFAARYAGRIAILGPSGERPVHARAAA